MGQNTSAQIADRGDHYMYLHLRLQGRRCPDRELNPGHLCLVQHTPLLANVCGASGVGAGAVCLDSKVVGIICGKLLFIFHS
jgi:hypothetical protein